jgi:cyclase
VKTILSLFLIGAMASISSAHTSLIKGAHVSEKQQQDVVIKTEKVAGNVYVLFGQGGNIGVSAGADGILMIDDQFERLADKIKAALKELGSDRPRFVFNTHWHGDHTGGNPVFGRDSIIVAHENVRKRLSRPKMFGRNGQTDGGGRFADDYLRARLIDSFQRRRSARRAFPNGHTDGDTVLFFTGSNVVHLGDDFFAGRFPFVDSMT